MVPSVLMTLRNTVQSPLPKGMGARLPSAVLEVSNITSERNTFIFDTPTSFIEAPKARSTD